MGAEAERQDKRLNDVYRKLMNELKPERKKELQEAQRLWIKYTQENCNFYLDPDGGTAARLAASECAVLAKAARAKELENFIQLPNKPHQMTWDQLTWDRGVKLVDSLGSSLRLW